MANKNIYIIINPKAGIKKKSDLGKTIGEWATQTNTAVEIVYTQYTEHAYELSKAVSNKQYDCVVCIGGDGTVNETGRGLIGSQMPLGIIPMGSGNGLARHLKIPLKPIDALNHLLISQVQNIDFICINDKISFNVSGIGFDAQVAHAFAHMKGRGLKNYIKATLFELNNSQPFEVETECAEQHYNHKPWMLSICNGSQFGNNAMVSPISSTNDGKMDLVYIKKPSIFEAIPLAFKLFNGDFIRSSLVEVIQAEKVRLRLKKKQFVHIDGEPIELEGEIHCYIGGQIKVMA